MCNIIVIICIVIYVVDKEMGIMYTIGFVRAELRDSEVGLAVARAHTHLYNGFGVVLNARMRTSHNFVNFKRFADFNSRLSFWGFFQDKATVFVDRRQALRAAAISWVDPSTLATTLFYF